MASIFPAPFPGLPVPNRLINLSLPGFGLQQKSTRRRGSGHTAVAHLRSPTMWRKLWASLRSLWKWLESAHTALWLVGLGGGGMISIIVGGIIHWIHVNTGWVAVTLIFTVSLALWLLGMWNLKRRIQSLQQEISYLRSGLVIHSPRYGAGDYISDVSDFLRREIAKGHRRIPVTNGLLDGADDPCPNTPKVLVVEYSRSNIPQKEKQTIRETLPPQTLALT
jgi:hypothetical protein